MSLKYHKKELINMERTIQMTVKFAPSTYKAIQKLAAKENINMSEVVRKYVYKGLEVQGYRDDLDFITGIIRQEVSAAMGMQAHRLRQIMFKIGVNDDDIMNKKVG